jgi:hypothetical protein
MHKATQGLTQPSTAKGLAAVPLILNSMAV